MHTPQSIEKVTTKYFKGTLSLAERPLKNIFWISNLLTAHYNNLYPLW